MTQPDVLIIGITGQAGAGKDTVADHLCSRHRFERDAFAEPLRDMLTAFLVSAGIDYDHLFDRKLKEQPLPHFGVSPRVLLQTLGTEWGRERSTCPDIWIKHAALRLGLHDLPRSSPIHDRIVLTDVRHLDEATWLRSHGARIVRITRHGSPSVAHHSSETQPIRADHVIRNDGTVDELHQAIDRYMAAITGAAT